MRLVGAVRLPGVVGEGAASAVDPDILDGGDPLSGGNDVPQGPLSCAASYCCWRFRLARLFMLRGSLLRRLVVCSLCLSAQTGAELVAAATWMWLTGLQVMDNGLALRYAPQFIACVSAEIVALALMLSGLRWLCRRFFPLDDSRSERVGRRGAAWLQRFALFPLIQVALIYSMVWIAFDVMRGDGTYMMATAALFVLCMAADVLLFLQMDQSFKQRRAELEASVLEAQVGEYLEELAAMQRLLDDTAAS